LCERRGMLEWEKIVRFALHASLISVLV